MTSPEKQKELLDLLPHFIAVSYRTILSATDDKAGVQSSLKTFSLSLRFLTILLISQYIFRDERDMSEPELNQLLTERLPFADLQDWYSVFVTTLKAYEGSPERLFVPEIYNLYWDCTDPTTRHHPRPDNQKILKELVALSNDWLESHAPKALPTNPNEWAALKQKVQQRLEQWLEQLAFLVDYELLRIVEVAQQCCSAERHVGLEVTRIEFQFEEHDLQPNWYYLSKGRRDFLKLEPLLTSWHTKNDATALFRRIQYARLLYMLAQSNDIFADDSRRDEFMDLLATIERYKKGVSWTEELTWLHVKTTAEELTSALMSTVTRRYDPEVYLQRREALGQFRSYLNSDKRCFVLTGKSGAGKSNFILSLVEEFKDDSGVCVMSLDASQVDVNKGLKTFLSEEFCRYAGGQVPQVLPDILEKIGQIPDMEDRVIVLVLDAINENMNPSALLMQANELLRQPYKWLKIVITSRPEAWQRACHGQRLAESLFYQSPVNLQQDEYQPYLSAYDMRPFNWEELQIVYARYRIKFSLKTDYHTLGIDVLQMIREPLQLWMIANTYEGNSIPEALPADRVVENYLEALIINKSLYSEDILMMQRELIPLLEQKNGQFVRDITGEQLYAAGNNMFERVFSLGNYSSGEKIRASFQRLADAQIFIAQVQQVKPVVKFKYERFYDHFFGQYLYQKYIESSSASLEACHTLMAAIQQSPFLWGAVQRALYIALDKGALALIKSLAQSADAYIPQLLFAILEMYSTKSPDTVRAIIRYWLALKGKSTEYAAVLRAKQIALRTALGTRDLKALELGLLDRDPSVQDMAVKYIFYLDENYPIECLEVLRNVSNQVMIWGLPNGHVLRILFPLTLLLLMERYRRSGDQHSGESIDEIVSILRMILRDVSYTGKGTGRVVGNLARSLFIKFLTGYIRRMLRHNLDEVARNPDQLRVSVNSLEEFSFFFSRPEGQRSPLREIIPYLDRGHGSLPDIYSQMVDIYLQEDIASITLLNLIITARGAVAPDQSFQAFTHLYEEICQRYSGDPNWIANTATGIAHNWYSILDRQTDIHPEWLVFLREMARCHIEEAPYGYGVTRTKIGKYIYHSLIFYGAIWSKCYPDQEIDLAQELLKRAEETNDQKLIIHIIDSYGDRRVKIAEYRGILRSLIPYVHSENSEIQAHMTTTLARIRNRKPEQVEHFLLESDAPKQLMDAVRQQSYAEPIYELTIRFGEFLNDLLMFAPPSTIQQIVAKVQKVEKATSLDKAIEVLIREVMNGIIGKNVFAG
jgi:hypothetical protein